MDYLESIAYLHSLTDYEKTRVRRYTPEAFDLSRVESMLEAVGNPHRRFRSVHIAGTKGKGSTAAMLESCLRAAGYRTALYTSPHLHTFRERIRVGGDNIGRGEVVGLVEELRPLVERMPELTTFEVITTMGFLHFARSGVDVAVVEVGLGGRLDATNVLSPEVALITSISRDHTYLLGDTLGEIAWEKGGIVKSGIPTVSAPQRAEAIQALEAISKERDSRLVEICRDWDYEAGPADQEGQSFTVRRIVDGGSPLDGHYWIPLLGRHQLENAASAVATLDLLGGRGFDIPVQAVHRGLREVEWPGRMEILSQDPLVVVDCAHNPYSARTLRQALEEWFPDRSWVTVFGASADKEIAGMLEALVPMSDYTIVTRANHPRAMAPIELADIVAEVGGGAEVSLNVRKSLERALAMMDPDNGLLATGSIFLVADLRDAWARHTGMPLPDNDGQ
ncbi:MAG: folylpolyglutamate synthase/dihydrofolate synthase family protein [Anaerolineae bacterium]|jgi:dihydrofolate synthase/folylpolyglutamate synthase